MGVSVVRRLGSGVPHDCAVNSGSGFCKSTAGPVAAGTVYAPNRSDPGVRVELRRCKSAGARVGGTFPIPVRAGPAWQRRFSFPESVFSQAAIELYLVG